MHYSLNYMIDLLPDIPKRFVFHCKEMHTFKLESADLFHLYSRQVQIYMLKQSWATV